MRKATSGAAIVGAAMLAWMAPGHAQRQSAAPVTDPSDPMYLTAQTRKMGGPMPAEQMALIFDHLDLSLKVFPDEKRIEGVTTLKLKTKAAIQTLILDLFPKFTIVEIDDRRPDDRAVGVLESRGTAPHRAREAVRGRCRVRGAGCLRRDTAARQASTVGRRHDVGENSRRQVIRGSTPHCGAEAAICSTRASTIRRSSRRRPISTTPCPTD